MAGEVQGERYGLFTRMIWASLRYNTRGIVIVLPGSDGHYESIY